MSFLVTSQKSTRGGVLCAACETKLAVRATGTTLVLGWWGFYGFFWTLGAIPKNLLGAWRFAERDARLLAMQALYFDSIGKSDLARAIAAEAHAIASNPKSLTAEQKRKAALGYEAVYPLQDVRDVMASFLAQDPPEGAKAVQLVRPHKAA